MEDKYKLLLVCYIPLDQIKDGSSFNSITSAIDNFFDDSVKILYVSTKKKELKIESINPKFVSKSNMLKHLKKIEEDLNSKFIEK